MRDDDELVEAFLDVSRALVGVAVRSVERADVPVTVVQHRCLVVLDEDGPLSIGRIAEELGVNQSNASRLCDRLERLSLVSRATSPDDRRSVRVRISAEGRQVLATVSDVRRQEIRAVLERLGTADAEATVQALRAFGEAAHELAPSAPG